MPQNWHKGYQEYHRILKGRDHEWCLWSWSFNHLDRTFHPQKNNWKIDGGNLAKISEQFPQTGKDLVEFLWISDVKLLVWDDIIVSNRELCLLQCVFFFLTFPEVLEWGGQDGLVFAFLEEWTKVNTGLTFGNATLMSHLIWAWNGNTWW